MNSLLVVSIALLLLLLGYVFYSRVVARWLGLDYEEPTPAVTMNDGVDYVPARHWSILFGHHFASIAGAAPILGPVIACLYWGWLPTLIWIVAGGVLLGAVHDFSALTLSVKHKGRSVADLTESILGRRSKIVFSLFVFLALILIVAVFAAVGGQTLAITPEVVIPTFGLIAVAIVVGLLMYRTNLPIFVLSAIGILMLFELIVYGMAYPIELHVASPAKWWTVILLVYGMIAAVLPVTILLQPRDHLAAAVLFFGMIFGFLGILISQPAVNAPPIVEFTSEKQGLLWPMLFVTVACGAISGFHSLVASGTTSKQLPRMKDARTIGYGGMITECALAVLAVIAVTAGLYWKDAPAGAQGFVYPQVYAKEGWIATFGKGYGQLTKPFLGIFGMLIGITMLKTFVMTTLDSATRITRYICAEMFGDTLGIKPLRNRYVATILVGVLAGALALGNWKAIWPVFGSANQLIAAMVLIIASVYLLTRRRRYLFTAVPALLMLLTTIGALIHETFRFLNPPKGGSPKVMLAVISVVLICLALFVARESIGIIRRSRKGAATAG